MSSLGGFSGVMGSSEVLLLVCGQLQMMVITAGDRAGLVERRGWVRDGSSDVLHAGEEVSPVASVEPHERQRIHHEVR